MEVPCAILVPFIFLLATLPVGRCQLDDEVVEAYISSQEDLVLDLAKWAEARHGDRVNLVKNCKCSKNGCSNDFDNAVCVSGLSGPVDLCAVEGQRRLDLETSTFRFPPETDPENLSNSLKESICVYKDIEEKGKEVVEEYGEDVYAGIYVGTVDGHFRSYPGFPRPRCEEDGDKKLNGCRFYDPRLRPWYISASTGPKDVVIVVDKSGSMSDFANTEGAKKWDLVTDAVGGIMRTLTFTDYVNIISFSDSAKTLWKQSGLAQGTTQNLRKLEKSLSKEVPKGHTNFTAAFDAAFQSLGENCNKEPPQCANCQKIILFLTDGRDNTQERGASIKSSAMMERIEQLQKQLEEDTYRRAVIFTFSISEEADDAIPRQIACANNGAWAFIGPQTKTLDALNSYYLYVSAGRRTETPIWIEPYEDASGLGIITTVAMPFYAKGTKTVPDLFLGVVAKDVLLSSLESGDTSGETLLRNHLIERSKRCSFVDDTPCELQLYRHANDERSLCLDPYPSTAKQGKKAASGMCYAFKGKFYRRFTKEVPWKSANARCKRSKGHLISIEDEEELAFVASLSAMEGSWIGAQRTPTHSFKWLNKTLSPVEEDSPFWGVQEPFFRLSKENCAAIDSRGSIGNMLAKACDEALSYICVYDTIELCAGELQELPKRGYFRVPPLNACINTAKVFAVTRPEYAAVEKMNSQDVMCDLGSPILNSEAVICCDPGDVPGFASKTCTLV